MMLSAGARPRGLFTGLGLRAGWVAAGVLLVSAVSLGALVGEYLAPSSSRLWVANVSWTAGALVAVVGVGTAWRQSDRRGRSTWTLLLVGCVAWLAGQVFWDAYSTTSIPPSPNPADFCWLAFAVISSAGAQRLHRAGESRHVSRLELAPLVVGVCALMSALLWSDVQTSTLSAAAKLTAVAYPVVYVSAAVVHAQAALRGTLDLRRNPGLAVVLIGLVLEAAAFMLWSPQLLAGTYAAGSDAVDGLWSGGLILIGLGAWWTSRVSAVVAIEQANARRGGILPSLTFAILVGIEILFIADHAPTGADLTLSGGVAVVGAALIARAALLRRELEDVNGRLSEESRADALTGLGNRLRLREDFRELSARAGRYDQGYALVLIDLDRFKEYNDDNGHQGGDHALRQVAALLIGHARQGDRAYRYGGEEMLLILPEQTLAAAGEVADRHRANLQAVALPHPRNTPFGVATLTAGVAVARPGETPEQVLQRADDALYGAKAAGRNRVTSNETQPNAPRSVDQPFRTRPIQVLSHLDSPGPVAPAAHGQRARDMTTTPAVFRPSSRPIIHNETPEARLAQPHVDAVVGVAGHPLP